ncbi:RECEPTOR KINASE-LIKE PROTEIN XA21 [Salix koriyanagi]|uniref:RECEPTOR KINASE-LIKE PROTEIN XA21 n=1 Tax=Salix koriyanagi TaxID=2511006 RepID=A0A9Q0SSY3_9ROSI|nr:RECEPTOR KINASE-LIKE PROTEIN XA21 [Salix koriyanagi]
MKEDEADSLWQVVLFIFLILITGSVVVVSGDSLETDWQVLLDLKSFLEERNHVNRGQYSRWNQQSSNPCRWSGILCTSDGSRVNGINLAASSISGDLYANFSSLTALTNLDLSQNTFSGAVPTDLSNCQNLVHLNLSHNILEGELNLTGLTKLETLDLSTNRIFWRNKPSENLLKEFSVSENYLSGEVSGSFFAENNCSLRVLDLSGNSFTGRVPRDLSNCRNLAILNLWGNNFTGQIPPEIGLISSLEGLFLGNNTFSPTIPESLLNLDNLAFLDLSRNNFGGEIQQIFGGFTRLKFLVLHGNSYTGGINSSGILKLPNLVGLDLSNNSFTGPLPVAFSEMHSLKLLILAYNRFNSTIPQEYGNFQALQALDLSFNSLTGQIPSSLGKLRVTFVVNACKQHVDRINCPYTSNLRLSSTGRQPAFWRAPWRVGKMQNFSMIHLGFNNLSGTLPPQIGQLPLVVLNLTRNAFSGEIPSEIGNTKCIKNLDFSYNNFSGTFPVSLNNLSELSTFNISYNPLISGTIPTTGQLATFEEDSYLGDPLLKLPGFINNSMDSPPNQYSIPGKKDHKKWVAVLVLLTMTMAFLICGLVSLVVCMLVKNPAESPGYLLEDTKHLRHDFASNSGSSSPWSSDTVKVIRLDRTAFTHADILKATGSFFRKQNHREGRLWNSVQRSIAWWKRGGSQEATERRS